MTPQDLLSLADELEEVGRQTRERLGVPETEFVAGCIGGWDAGVEVAVAYLRGKAEKLARCGRRVVVGGDIIAASCTLPSGHSGVCRNKAAEEFDAGWAEGMQG